MTARVALFRTKFVDPGKPGFQYQEPGEPICSVSRQPERWQAVVILEWEGREMPAEVAALRDRAERGR